MIIEATEHSDLAAVAELVARVSEASIFPYFSEEGRSLFAAKVLPDVQTAFDREHFQSFKVTQGNQVIGFGAIRERSYITHLFVDTSYQGKGLGKLLLKQLLALGTAKEIRLRASVNAVNFISHKALLRLTLNKKSMASALFRWSGNVRSIRANVSKQFSNFVSMVIINNIIILNH
ncbi:COG0454 Histone acetyltransferase HPA2 and related acetyltransferases [Vibrio sp. B1FLJ16]|nr:GNAT family N-acetyltransferase [Vibrio sp. B1FLJ16]CAD7818968.1 COG0454 Histone acetyltransferase HPA2 and related acetyltransferases [Vibrio sp. B1FLJ16]CAE6936838.1 COG0454 Histone acetyltransferase HPA2 and related acetyltransferases [Vibrio sp. B1FLJ16]